jgi:hypothetical protein
MTAIGELLGAAALVLAACSDGSEGSGAHVAAGGHAGAAAGADGGGGPGGSSESQDLGGFGGDATAPPAGAAPPPRLMRYLTSATDRSLRVELDSVSGLEPHESSVASLRDKFSALLEKPDGVNFEADETLEPAGDSEWTFERLDAYARAHASDDEAAAVTIQVLSLDGRYVGEEGSGTVLGLAWGQRFIALFQDAIRGPCASGVLGALQQENCEIAERNVWAHEIGHVIGLVDNGVTMGVAHRDPEHGRHDVSDECVMYWAYDGPQIFDTLLGRIGSGRSPDLDFCAQCQADIAAVR